MPRSLPAQLSERQPAASTGCATYATGARLRRHGAKRRGRRGILHRHGGDVRREQRDAGVRVPLQQRQLPQARGQRASALRLRHLRQVGARRARLVLLSGRVDSVSKTKGASKMQHRRKAHASRRRSLGWRFKSSHTTASALMDSPVSAPNATCGVQAFGVSGAVGRQRTPEPRTSVRRLANAATRSVSTCRCDRASSMVDSARTCASRRCVRPARGSACARGNAPTAGWHPRQSRPSAARRMSPPS